MPLLPQNPYEVEDPDDPPPDDDDREFEDDEDEEPDNGTDQPDLPPPPPGIFDAERDIMDAIQVIRDLTTQNEQLRIALMQAMEMIDTLELARSLRTVRH